MIVRADLPHGIQSAMIIHASDESPPDKPVPGTYAIALTCADEVSLARQAARLEQAGIAFTRIYEPDPPWNGALMALGIFPRRKEELRRYLSSLPCLK